MKGTMAMRHTYWRAGFSLMEVNMAVFVMAVGIMSLVGLFPLGLRESYQGKADLQQAMFADYALNQLVAALSQPDVTWDDWRRMHHTAYPLGVPDENRSKTPLPASVSAKLTLPGFWTVSGEQMNDNHYRIFFDLVKRDNNNHPQSEDTPSAFVMGIGVRSTDVKANDYNEYTNKTLYYAEVLFQGDPR